MRNKRSLEASAVDSDCEVIAEDLGIDEDLLEALALSMQSPAEASAGAASAGAASAEAPTAAAAAAASPRQKRPLQPMRGKRARGTGLDEGVQTTVDEPPPAKQQQLPQPPLPQQQQQQEPPPQQQQQQHQPALPSPSPAAAAATAAGAAAKPPKQPQQRKKKLPAFNPSADDVEAVFKVLSAEGQPAVTVASIQTVGHKLGQAIDQATAHNMMQLAAARVLGWGSGAGRSQGARGALSLAEFKRLVDHFRV